MAWLFTIFSHMYFSMWSYTWGCTGFDGDCEVWQASSSRGDWVNKPHLKLIADNNSVAFAA